MLSATPLEHCHFLLLPPLVRCGRFTFPRLRPGTGAGFKGCGWWSCSCCYCCWCRWQSQTAVKLPPPRGSVGNFVVDIFVSDFSACFRQFTVFASENAQSGRFCCLLWFSLAANTSVPDLAQHKANKGDKCRWYWRRNSFIWIIRQNVAFNLIGQSIELKYQRDLLSFLSSKSI